MAPELAAAYVIGWIPSAGITGLHLWLHRKKIKSPAYRQLQNNLKKINLTWRESRSDIEPLYEGKEEADLKAYEKNIFLMGAFFLFLSWGGFIFNLIVLVSVHALAVSRKERWIMDSDLTRKDVSPEDVQAILKELP
ncbi:hypothetical protein EZJ49_01870 [Bdellovibrio bacteriovorus]|uniref:hypothetical protein n=1 Tax=Bdellovibrio bacteriovorus TaxID=959 RepID=UPI0021CE6C64|nr:hypothetical protein [Bdellovibrio bacteriovorus]UXR64996.1 hypothetical protein EZJ49_01870 [Bdellovibrio bacteriovorus]